MNPSYYRSDGDNDPSRATLDSARAPISRASSATTTTTTASAVDDVSTSKLEPPFSQSSRPDEDDEYDDEDNEAFADGDTTIAGPPSPATTLTIAAVDSLGPATTSTVRGKGEKSLTRRERKKLGLPKPRPRRVILKVNGQRPGSIRPPAASSDAAEPAPGDQAWAKNGSGRMDTRGFRELKI